MFNQIVLSGLLLSVGVAIYFIAIRRWLSAIYAKWWLVSLLFLSVTIPTVFPHLPNYSEALAPNQAFDYDNYNQWNVVDISDPELQSCYNKSADSKDFCHCEVVQKAKILVYKPNPWYDFLLGCYLPALYLLWLVTGLWLLDLLLKWAYLWNLVRRSPKVRYELNGTVFYLLYPSHRYFPLSSFTLWQHYILWSPVLETFSEEERLLIFAHEIGHLRQRDTWVQFFWRSVGIFWWMNPLYYLIRNELKRLNEFVADEFALSSSAQDPRKYARLLIRAKEYQLQYGKEPAYAFSFAQSLLKTRVLHILNKSNDSKKHQRHRWGGYLIGTGLLLCGLCAWAQPTLDQQSIDLQQYEVLQKENAHTGKHYFCKDCLTTKLKTN